MAEAYDAPTLSAQLIDLFFFPSLVYSLNKYLLNECLVCFRHCDYPLRYKDEKHSTCAERT